MGHFQKCSNMGISYVMYCRYMSSENEEKNLTAVQCSALAFLLLMSSEDFEEFDLKKYQRSDRGLHRMLPVVKVSRKVW